MSDAANANDRPQADSTGRQAEEQIVRGASAYSSAIATTVRNNASAYGFSVAITCSFGVVVSVRGSPTALDALLFALGAATSFLTTETVVSRRFRRGIRTDPGNVVVVSSAIDALSILSAVAVAIGLARVPGLAAWPLSSFCGTGVYLLVGGLDIIIARRAVRLTSHPMRSD